METENSSNSFNETRQNTETEKDFNPYVGPVPFNYEKRAYFFGREEEAEILLSMVISERVILFYAQSGAGKSSLLNAELIPRLREKEYQVLSIARVGGDLPEDLKAKELENIYVFNTLWCLIDDKKKYKSLINVSLSDFVKDLREGNEDTQCWLILDQMEEILTTYPEYSAKRRDFFVQLRTLLDSDPLLSVIIAMREDHIAGLDNYASLLPGRLETRFRIEKLKYDAAIQAIKLPPTIANSTAPGMSGNKRVFDHSVAEELVNDLRKIKASDGHSDILGDYVEPVQLQVVCYNMWKNLDAVKNQKTVEEDRIITSEDREKYANVDQALSKFYEDTVDLVAKETGVPEVKIRRWFGETLITSGIRSQVKREAAGSGGLPNEAVDLFLKEHLIRVEPARGGMWYELSHDRLIEPIVTSNTKWYEVNLNVFQRQAKLWDQESRPNSLLLTEEMMDEVEEWVNQNLDNLTPTERSFWYTCSKSREEATEKDKKRYRRYTFAAVALALFGLLASTVAFGFYWRSEAVNKDLSFTLQTLKDKQDDLDTKNKLLGENQEILNKKNEELTEETKKAIKQTEIADDKRKEAKKQTEIAKEERKKALEQTKIADELRSHAEKTASDALKAKQTEKNLREEAEDARKKAKKLEDLGQSYKSIFSSIAINDIPNTLNGFKKVLEQYEEIDREDGSEVTQNEGRFSTYIALIDKNTQVIESSEGDSKELLEYEEDADKYFKLAATLALGNSSQLKFLNDKRGDLLFAIADKEKNRSTALRNYSISERLYAETGSKEKQFKALVEIGKIYFDRSRKGRRMAPYNVYGSFTRYFDRAVNVYDEKDSNRGKVLNQIAEFYASRSNQRLAAETFNKAGEFYKSLGEKEKSVDAFIYAGQAYELSDIPNKENENPYFNSAIQAFPDDSTERAARLYEIAEFYASRNNQRLAAETFNKAGEIYKTLGKKDFAVDAFISAGQSFELSDISDKKENRYYKSAIGIYADNEAQKAEILFRIADQYLTQEKNSKAEEYFALVADYYLKSNEPVKAFRGLINIARFQKDPSQKQIYYVKAVNIIKQFMGINPDRALIELISVAGTLKDPKRKVQFYNDVLGKNGDKPGEDELKELFDRLKTADEKALMRISIGNAYLEAGDESTAWDDFYEEAIQTYAETDKVNKAWTMIEVGKSYRSSEYKEKDKKAEERFKEAQDLFSNNLEKALTSIEICKAKYTTDVPDHDKCLQSTAEIVNDFLDKAKVFYEIGKYYETIAADDFWDENNDKLKRSTEYFNKSREAYIKANNSPGESSALVKEAISLYKLDPKPTSSKLQKNIADALKLQANDQIGTAKILVEISNNLISAGVYESWAKQENIDYLSKAIEIYKQLPDPPVDDYAKAYTEILRLNSTAEGSGTGEHPLTKEAFVFYENYITKISYYKDGLSTDSTICLSCYKDAMGDEKAIVLYKKVAEKIEEQNQLPLKSIEERRKQLEYHKILGEIYLYLDDKQKAQFNYWIAVRLNEQTGNLYARDFILTYFEEDDSFYFFFNTEDF